jgi:hypothetical protein
MEGIKPNLDVFDQYRFAEWRPGQETRSPRNHRSPDPTFSDLLYGILAWLFS